MFTPCRVTSQLSGPAHRAIPRWAASVGCHRWKAQAAWLWGGRNWQGAEGVERGQELNTVPLLWAVTLKMGVGPTAASGVAPLLAGPRPLPLPQRLDVMTHPWEPCLPSDEH